MATDTSRITPAGHDRGLGGVSRRGFLRGLGATSAVAVFGRLLHSPWAAQAQDLDAVEGVYRALVDTVLPSTPSLPHSTGALDLLIHEFVMEAVDSFLPLIPSRPEGMRLREVMAAVIETHAAQVTPGTTFLNQTPEERTQTLAAMDASPSGDVRFVVFALTTMVALAFYSEWPAYGWRYDVDALTLADPAELPVWGEIGFPGPAHFYAKRLSPDDPGMPVDPADPAIP